MNRILKWIAGVSLLILFALAPPMLCCAMDAADAPDDVDLDAMVKYYDKVEFPHSMHVDMVEGDCSICHHHTTGTPVTNPICIRCHKNSGEQDSVACRDCHALNPFSATNLKDEEAQKHYHIDKPGLKVAYHLNCRGCHVKMDGPIGCEDCHAMTDAGKKLYDTGEYTPKHKGKGHHH